MNFSMLPRIVIASVLTIFAVTTGAPGAGSLPQPSEKPMLTVSGKIGVSNKDGAAQFDRTMLEAMGMVEIETTTPWYKGLVKFEGVPLAKLMAAVQASGDKIVAVALNDYAVEVPMEDISKYNVILALKRDGEYMPVRDKGRSSSSILMTAIPSSRARNSIVVRPGRSPGLK